MSLNQQLQLLKRLHELIRRKATGTPEQLAARLEMSRANMYRYLEELKTFGAPVKYCKFRRCYYYEEPFELKF